MNPAIHDCTTTTKGFLESFVRLTHHLTFKIQSRPRVNDSLNLSKSSSSEWFTESKHVALEWMIHWIYKASCHGVNDSLNLSKSSSSEWFTESKHVALKWFFVNSPWQVITCKSQYTNVLYSPRATLNFKCGMPYVECSWGRGDNVLIIFRKHPFHLKGGGDMVFILDLNFFLFVPQRKKKFYKNNIFKA